MLRIFLLKIRLLGQITCSSCGGMYDPKVSNRCPHCGK